MDIKVIDNGQMDYSAALRQQEQIFRHSIERKHLKLPVQHYLILNEHNPVVTMGKHADPTNVLIPKELLHRQGITVLHTNRGGDVTYHGPGQWTIYPIFDLEELNIGIRGYVERLEEVAIRTLLHYGLRGERLKGASGVWMHTDTRPVKVCAIGIQASRFITMHGIAFNVSTPPTAFGVINPCGFTDRGVTNLSIEAGRDIPMSDARDVLLASFSSVFDRTLI